MTLRVNLWFALAQMTSLEKAIEAAGGFIPLADAIGVTKQAVAKWCRRELVPPDRVISVARAAGWRVTPHELRPDIYPNESDGLPQTTGVLPSTTPEAIPKNSEEAA